MATLFAFTDFITLFIKAFTLLLRFVGRFSYLGFRVFSMYFQQLSRIVYFHEHSIRYIGPYSNASRTEESLLEFTHV